MHHQLVDVSDYYTVIEVAGAQARELLMKLTTLDLHPRAFRPGMVAGGTSGAPMRRSGRPAMRTGGRPVFRLFVRWSMADYLWCLLAECGPRMGPAGAGAGEGRTPDDRADVLINL